jgi:pyruvate dehydrogenase E2 component (dihydrolipoamide acetyltransferase)
VTRVIEVRVPDMGNFKDVAVIDVLVKPGDSIEPETPLVTLETEKATMDVPSTVGGVVERVAVSKGGHVSAGDVVVAVRSEDAADAAAGGVASDGQAGGAQAKAAPAPPAAPAARPPPAAPAAPAGKSAQKEARPAAAAGTEASRPSTGAPPFLDEPGFSRAHASPSVRRFARELGVDLAAVSGTGFKERITADDVKAFVKKTLPDAARAPAAGTRGSGLPALPALPALPSIDFSQFGPTEVKPLGRIRRISAARLHASWVNLPHVTQFDEADITELEATRNSLKSKAAEEGIKLTPLAFIMRACVKALQEFPEFNSSLDPSGENLIYKKYLNLGFAADTPNGLLVPVVLQADHKDVYELARALAELSEKARSGTLNVTQMQGGCFTISSLGGIGGTAFTPIINAPEVAILGVSRSAYRPVYRDGTFVPRLILPLSLSYDHRVIDGALAVRFTSFLTQVLSDPPSLLEAVP